VSSAFVPTDTMPGPVRAFADNQPVTAIVNTIRALLDQQPVGPDIWTALARFYAPSHRPSGGCRALGLRNEFIIHIDGMNQSAIAE
jgi:hypothetical protein